MSLYPVLIGPRKIRPWVKEYSWWVFIEMNKDNFPLLFLFIWNIRSWYGEVCPFPVFATANKCWFYGCKLSRDPNLSYTALHNCFDSWSFITLILWWLRFEAVSFLMRLFCIRMYKLFFRESVLPIVLLGSPEDFISSQNWVCIGGEPNEQERRIHFGLMWRKGKYLFLILSVNHWVTL